METHKVISLAIAVLLISVLFSVSAVPVSLAKDDRGEIALRYVSEKYGVPIDQLDVAYSADLTLPTTGVILWDAKVINVYNGDAYSVTLDSSNEVVDKDEFVDLEAKAYNKMYGKKDKDLYDHLQGIEAKGKVTVWIWYKSDIERLDREITRAEILARLAEEYERRSKPLIQHLERKGFSVEYAAKYSPLIIAEGSKSGIEELDGLADVDKMYLSTENKDFTLNSMRLTHGWPKGWGGVGDAAGVMVAVHEPDGISTPNPYLGAPVYWKPASPKVGPYPDNHATMVAGVVASRHTTYRGAARMVTLLSANSQDWTDANLVAALEWAIANGADIVNLSWGYTNPGPTPNAWSRYLSRLMPYYAVTPVAAAGNYRSEYPDNRRVTDPARGKNVFCVGGFDDMNTGGWGDDTMWAGSQYDDPASPHNDIELPHFVAVGTRVYTTDWTSPWISPEVSGTSFSAPAVAGMVATLMHKKPFLETWPEVSHAALMASAVNNIEGGVIWSEKDGQGGVWMGGTIGGIYVNGADDVIMKGWFKYGSLLGVSPGWTTTYTFTASAGEQVRVALFWDAHPANVLWPPTDPSKDYDLTILSPTGAVVASSTRYDPNFEVARFIAPVSGTYKARIRLFASYPGAPSSEYFGLAWWRGPSAISGAITEGEEAASLSSSVSSTPTSQTTLMLVTAPILALALVSIQPFMRLVNHTKSRQRKSC